MSTTSSVGTRIWPNCSSMPARMMRSVSARCTLFSMPEYACTTYQRFFPALETLCAPTGALSCVLSLMLFPAQNYVIQQEFEQFVSTPKEDCHDHHKGKNDCRDLHCFFTGRPDDFLGFTYRFFGEADKTTTLRRRPGKTNCHQQAGHQGQCAHCRSLIRQNKKTDHASEHCHDCKSNLELVAGGIDGLYRLVRHLFTFSTLRT